MAYKYHSINDFIKVIRVMHKKSITLEEIIYDPAGEEDKEAQIAAHFDETVKYKGRVHMKPGDICEVEISGLGILTNQVVADKGNYQIF